MREQKNREKVNDWTFVKILQVVWSAGINVNSMRFEGERIKEKNSSKKETESINIDVTVLYLQMFLYSNFFIYYTPIHKYLFVCFV